VAQLVALDDVGIDDLLSQRAHRYRGIGVFNG
jgi:hypothetical protein